MTRRSLLAVPLAAGARAQGRHRIHWTRAISAQPEFYHGWPTLARRRNGELFVVYSGGREAHICPFGRVEMMRSSDDGETWSWPEVLMDSAIDDRDAGVCETARGSLLVTTFTSLAYENVREQGPRWAAVNRRMDAARRKQLLGTWMLRSADGGSTWSAPFRVPLNSPHGPIALSDGRLLYAGKQLWEPSQTVGVAESKDDGVTWKWMADIPVRAGDRHVAYHELHAVEAAPGRILVHIRNQNAANDRETLQCESADGGRSWSEPHAIGVWGLPSHLLRLRDGRLLMSYGYRRAPFGNQARISEDSGRTWSAAMTLSADAAGVDVGYPSTVELAGGDLLTLWYEKPADSPRAALRLARWSL